MEQEKQNTFALLEKAYLSTVLLSTTATIILFFADRDNSELPILITHLYYHFIVLLLAFISIKKNNITIAIASIYFFIGLNVAQIILFIRLFNSIDTNGAIKPVAQSIVFLLLNLIILGKIKDEKSVSITNISSFALLFLFVFHITKLVLFDVINNCLLVTHTEYGTLTESASYFYESENVFAVVGNFLIVGFIPLKKQRVVGLVLLILFLIYITVRGTVLWG